MRIFTSILTLLLICQAALFAQIQNVNPDPKGEPWIVGGLRQLTDADWEKLNNIPELIITESSRKKDLPSSVDNSQNSCFRPIFNQEGGSCGQASGVGYNYTYEIDFERGLAANTIQTQYPTHFTWNFLNNGNGGGSWYFDGWEIINTVGCPNVEDYGGSFAEGGDTRWLSGYNEYHNGMKNRVLEVSSINTTTPEGLETIKHWMNDHGDGSEIGGLVNFGAGASGYDVTSLASGTPHSGKSVITKWDSNVNHAMTFCGYDDEVRFDYNGDGEYTNDKDINGDDIIDMRDWEIGALIVVNSWGPWWEDDGKCYMMYKLLAEPSSNGGIWNNLVHVIRAKNNYEPLLTLKAKIKHTSRKKIKLLAGVSSNTSATTPDVVKSFPLFCHQGGDFYMQGGYSEDDKTIELGLDITSLLSEITPGANAKFFLQVIEKDAYGESEGEIVSFSVIDYTNGENETTCDQSNVAIVNDGTTTVSVTKAVDYTPVTIDNQTIPNAIAA